MICPTLLLNAYAHPVCKVYWKNTVCPTLFGMVCTSLTRKSTERIRFVPHCWDLRMVHTYVANTKVCWKNTVCPTLFLNGTYVANTKLYWKNMAVAEWYIPCEHEILWSALHVAMCAAMSEIWDILQKRKEGLQAIPLQPDGHLGHLL